MSQPRPGMVTHTINQHLRGWGRLQGAATQPGLKTKASPQKSKQSLAWEMKEGRIHKNQGKAGDGSVRCAPATVRTYLGSRVIRRDTELRFSLKLPSRFDIVSKRKKKKEAIKLESRMKYSEWNAKKTGKQTIASKCFYSPCSLPPTPPRPPRKTLGLISCWLRVSPNMVIFFLSV